MQKISTKPVSGRIDSSIDGDNKSEKNLQRSIAKESFALGSSKGKMVAGAGFEPTTSGL